MRKLAVFNNVSLDGYFTDRNGDMSWAHNQDEESNTFTRENAGSGGILVFGRGCAIQLRAKRRRSTELRRRIILLLNNSSKQLLRS
jgi:hypothetical protein